MTDWKDLLKEKGFLLSDGSWGVELAKRGLAAGECPELWNDTHRRDIHDLAKSYVDAGSDIILTNTFGGSRWKLEKCGLAERTTELNALGVEGSLKAADGRALVFASVGPTGEFMVPLGLKTEEEFIEVFAEQIGAIIKAGADGIVIETMTSIEEASAALNAARSIGDFPVVVSMTFDKGPGGFATMMGVKPEIAAGEFARADIVGANCGSGIVDMIEVAKLMRPATRRPLWIKSNAGLPELVEGETCYRETPEQMTVHLEELVRAGANIIGGCCGTSPKHIRRFAALQKAQASLAIEKLNQSVDL